MTSARRTTVVAVFKERGEADRAVDELLRAGFKSEQIGVVGPDGKRKRGGRGKKDDTLADEGAVAGAVAGAGVGGLIGLGILAGVIPVIGPAIAAGTLGTILLNAAGGAALASVAGALIGLGIPEEEAAFYEKELKTGRYLVTVDAKRRAAEALTILRRNGGYEMDAESTTTTTRATRSSAVRTSEQAAARSTTTTDGRTLKLHEEELRATKTPVRKGEVKVRKEVVTEKKTLTVPVTREEVVIERRPAGSRRVSSSAIKAGEEIRIPVKAEQVRVTKEPVVTEEVRVGKRQVQESRTVSGTVRKERARVEQVGEVNVKSESNVTQRGSRR